MLFILFNFFFFCLLRPSISNLINYYLFQFYGLTIEQIVNEYKNSDNKKFKESVIESIVQHLQPIQTTDSKRD